MGVIFTQTTQFEKTREYIEKHLFDAVLEIEQDEALALRSVTEFAESLERLFSTLEQMYQTPRSEDAHSEKSFPIHAGRYRIFFKVLVRDHKNFEIVMLDIDDNKQSNLDRFATHQIISFNADE